MKIVWFAAVAVCTALQPGTATPAPVKVEGGLVQGVAADGLTVYKGLPFATPPVGDLRWRAPRPVAPWTDVLKADRFAPDCVPSMGNPTPGSVSEDCLYLNVWSPAKSEKDRLPVLVWIYGGGFNAGSTSVPVHDGARLARRGVILASVNYRVGVLGFLAHPGLSAESPHHVSGNYGLLDMIAGLQWIQRNIAAFGGDPDRVTIFGESAGGIAVSMLCASPLAKGLFHGAISQSGGSFGPVSKSPSPGENMRSLADAEVSGAEMAKAAGAPSLEELRALPAEKVVEAGRRQRGMAWPITEGWVIPDDQYKLYEAGRFNDTPILVGYNSDEGLSFTRVRSSEEYVAGVRTRYGAFADRLLEAYPTASDRIPKTARDLSRDSAFGWQTWSWARLQSSRGKGKAFLYYFDQHPERVPGSPDADHGAPHGVDVPYVFETLDATDRPVTEADRRISDAMAAYWTNFAKHGDPNGSALPAWPAFSDSNAVVMSFDGTPKTGPVPSEGSLKVLDGYFAWRRGPEGATAASLPFRDPALPLDTRVDDLIGRMTLEEKASQLVNRTRAIPRLNVPEYNLWSEALHGVAGGGFATVFPQAIGLAATFDAPTLHEMAGATAREARVKYNQAARAGRAGRMMGGLTFFSPNINIFRDPRWGRGQETYGEDPFLAGQLGVAFITGMQGADPDHPVVTATAKHYAVHSGPEPLRHGFDAKTSTHDIEDTYLPAFRAAVVEGRVKSVMCVYNAVNGVPGCASESLLDGTLREQWKFEGFVTGDCDAVRDVETGHKYARSAAEAGAFAIKAGLDNDCTTSVLFGSTGAPDYQRYVDALKEGLLTEAEVDVALARMLRTRFQLGLFDPPAGVKAAQVPDSELDSPAHRELAAKLARESLVLLKNDGVLPFVAAPARIAVVGPLADNSRVLLGNYNGYPSRSTTALAGIQRQFPKARVVFEPGTTYLRPDVPVPASALSTGTGTPGLKAEVFEKPDFSGTPIDTRTDAQVLVGRDRSAGPPPNFDAPQPPARPTRWTGFLTPPETGTYRLGVERGGNRLFLDDKKLVDTTGGFPPPPAVVDVVLEKGRRYAIRIESNPRRMASTRLVWMPPQPDAESRAVAAARAADVVVAIVGITSELEGEESGVQQEGFKGGDRTSLDLPREEQRLLEAVKSTGKPLIVVVMSGSAIALNWAQQNANAILQAWYPGEEGGTAIAQTLDGTNNPSGRLPITVYTGVDQLPDFTDYSMARRTYRYFDGKPLYPFGHGLSYSTFAYSSLKVPATLAAGEPLRVEAQVANTGTREGDEVAQVYLTFPKLPGVPLRALRGFTRVHLKAGEQRTVQFTLGDRELSHVSPDGIHMVSAGRYGISVGGGQPQTGAPVVTGAFDITGERTLPR